MYVYDVELPPSALLAIRAFLHATLAQSFSDLVRGRHESDRGAFVGPMRRGTERVGWAFTFAAAAYNLERLPKLLVAAT